MMSTYDLYKTGTSTKVGMMTIDFDEPIPPDPPEPPVEGDVIITGVAGGREIAMLSAANRAGGFSDMSWGGQDFIVSVDYGQGLQSAIRLNGMGEGCNPTEHGGSINTPGTSMSKLLERTAQGNTLMSKTQMAYWQPVNGQALSDCILTKKVQINTEWTDHAIQMDLVFTLDKDYTEAMFEVITGYMPSAFSKAWGYNPQTHDLEESADKLPIILSTPDGNYAMGCFSPDRRFTYDDFTKEQLEQDMVKWNCGMSFSPAPKGDYPFKVFVIVGTLENVRVSMVQLHDAFPDTDPIPETGMIWQKSGQFLMSGQYPYWGTYRPATLYNNGQVELTGPQESFYSFYQDMVTTECPAGVWKRINGQWSKRRESGIQNSLAFDIHPIDGGLSLFTIDSVTGKAITMMRSDDNGMSWYPYKSIQVSDNEELMQCYSDGIKEYLVGYRDRCPVIMDLNKNIVMHDKSYKDQKINFACYFKGVVVLGCNNIDAQISDGSRRNGYLTYWDGSNHIAGRFPNGEAADLHAPFIMNIKPSPDGTLWAVASEWNETVCKPELVSTKDGKNWSNIIQLPIPSVQTIEPKADVVYCYGGQKDSWGGVYCYKL